ncbi:hypothetical protein M0R45_004939 [Rubus argutus]|uniref:Uncharacterized protein n=1 Tax=Rubus argutus TaxID=59490 RepID=A0AAW1YL71_RUBAR
MRMEAEGYGRRVGNAGPLRHMLRESQREIKRGNGFEQGRSEEANIYRRRKRKIWDTKFSNKFTCLRDFSHKHLKPEVWNAPQLRAISPLGPAIQLSLQSCLIIMSEFFTE